MKEQEQVYDWAQAVFAVASTNSRDLAKLAEVASLDPKGGDLSDIDLSGLDLSGQNFSGWDLRNAKFQNTRLTNTELRNAIIDPYELINSSDWETATLDDELRLTANRLAMLAKRIDKLDLPVLLEKWLIHANCEFVGDLVQKTEAELLKIKGIVGHMNEIKEVLNGMGLGLGMRPPGWPEKFQLRRIYTKEPSTFNKQR